MRREIVPYTVALCRHTHNTSPLPPSRTFFFLLEVELLILFLFFTFTFVSYIAEIYWLAEIWFDFFRREPNLNFLGRVDGLRNHEHIGALG